VQHLLYSATISRRPVTGPVARFARQIASQGYIVAAPSSYHEFTGPEPLAYDGPGTDAGNEWKITKKVSAYDEDAKLSVDILLDLPTCNGRIGATGSFFSLSIPIQSTRRNAITHAPSS
jgi:dienelactone hydrolase